MYDKNKIRSVMQRLTHIRTCILREYPFFGQLLMYLGIGVGKCGTAYTDMKRIVYDPDFVDRLDDDELIFLMLHEVMHCVLKHCVRGKNLDQDLYNVACDIVVNSNIMQTMGVSEFIVDGEPVMNKDPKGIPGYRYTAEELYHVLEQSRAIQDDAGKGIPRNVLSENGSPGEEIEDDISGDIQEKKKGSVQKDTLDSHDEWEKVVMTDHDLDQFENIVIHTAGTVAGNGLSTGIRNLIEDYERESQVDWRKVLQDFIQLHYERFDFTFLPSDRRFSYLDYALPSFHEMEEEAIENIWFLVDTSGSISDEVLNTVFAEIKAALSQFEYLSGKLSFFDTQVSDPVSFSRVEDLKDIKAMGGGGTSFHIIFKYMSQNMMEDPPTAIVILTDGYAEVPPEESALGVPVLWMICDSDETPEWGQTVHIKSDG